MIPAVAPVRPWYVEWFGRDYLRLYAHRDKEEAERHVLFVESLFAGRPRAILDLACGAGRHTEALRERGHRTLGTDLSLTLLATSPHLPRVGADMRRLPFADASFDWVLNFFTSFGYFEEERQNFCVLQEVVRVLMPGGRLLIDLMNPSHALPRLTPCEVQEVGGERVEISRWYDPGTRRLNKRIRLIDGREREFVESVRLYSRDEVVIGMRWAGLEVSDQFGGFDGQPYREDSERLILLAYKA